MNLVEVASVTIKKDLQKIIALNFLLTAILDL